MAALLGVEWVDVDAGDPVKEMTALYAAACKGYLDVVRSRCCAADRVAANEHGGYPEPRQSLLAFKILADLGSRAVLVGCRMF